MSRITSKILLSAAFAIGCASCSQQQNATTTYPVEGKVTFPDGEPVAGVIVWFEQLDNKAVAMAKTDEDGRYRIGAEGDPGLPVGDYRVTVAPPVEGEVSLSAKMMDPRYANKKTAGLVAGIDPIHNFYNIEVDRREE